MDLTFDNIFGLLQSAEEFPVDFDDAWRWIGYSRKDAAKLSLLNAGFLPGNDFRFSHNIMGKSERGRPIEKIWLTVDCFKSFAMMAGTDRGRQVRAYFLNCERRLKEELQRQENEYKQRIVDAVVQDFGLPWNKRFGDPFFDEAYRVNGWNRPLKGHPPCMGKFINDVIYDRFPQGVPQRLRQVNPKNSKGNRSRKNHQHLTPELGIPLLESQKAVAVAVMRLSPDANPEKFKRNMSIACGRYIQGELPFMEA